MENIYSFIYEKLTLNNQSQLKEKKTSKEVEELAEYIIKTFQISVQFIKYKELKDALINYIIDNNITKEKLNTPYINGKDIRKYIHISPDNHYLRGRYRRVADCMKNASIIVGDPKSDFIVFYFSNDCLLCHTTELNSIDLNIFFLIR